MRYGLTEQTIQQISSVFEKHPVVKQAVLYGSRAKGNYKPGSDIDLSLFGEDISRREVNQILDELDALDLPYTIDMTVFKDIRHAKFRDHIARVGVVFYQRDDEGQPVQSVEGAELDCCAGTGECEVPGFYQRDVVAAALSKNFNMPSNCEKVMLGEVCKLINGRAYSQNELLSEGRYPVLRVGNFFSNRKWYYSDLELAEDKYCNCGDLLYAWSASFGPKIWDGGKTIFHYHIWKAKINETRIDKFFLNYWFEWDKETIKKETGAGTTMIHVTKKSMEERKLSLPPLQEQKRIVAILDDAFERIDTAIANTEKNLANARELYESYLGKSFTQTGDDWKFLTLREASIDFGRGKSKHRPRNDPSLYGGEYPFVQTGDVRGADHYINSYSQTYNDKGLSQSKLWPKGTVCITIAANIAETGILSFDSCFPDSVIGAVSNGDITSGEYIEYIIQFMKNELKKEGKGSAQDNINLATFEGRAFPFAPIQKQVEIVSDLNLLRETTRSIEVNCQRKIATLEELKQSLLQKAFSGELTADFNPDALEH